tara:strand:+ start:9478 stop:9789 length:312 start_codon:yes stop_codon:yes gene_type:complete
MMRIYTNNDRFMVWQVKQLLDEHKIPCFIKNEFASGAMGELSPLDCQPEVWLNDASWQARAETLIEQMQEHTAIEWVCSGCGETNGGNFEVCWQCGQEKHVDQ